MPSYPLATASARPRATPRPCWTAALLLLAIAAATPAAAGPLVVLPREVVMPGRAVQQPQVAMAADGRFAVAWVEPTAAGLELRLQVYPAQGGPGPAATVAVEPGLEELPYELVMNDEGHAVLVWASELRSEVAVRVRRADGTLLPPATIPADAAPAPWNAASIFALHAALGADGRLAAGWTAEMLAGGSQTGQRSFAALWPPATSERHPAAEPAWVERVGPGPDPWVDDVALDGAGRLLVLLDDHVPVVLTLDATGVVADRTAAPGPGAHLFEGRLAVDGGGEVMLVALAGGPRATCPLLALLPWPPAAGGGVVLPAPFEVGCQGVLGADGAADGGFLVQFRHAGLEPQRGRDGYWLQPYDAAGRATGPPLRVPFLLPNDLAYEAGGAVLVGLPVEGGGGLVLQRLGTPPVACEPARGALCLAGGRFRASADWLSPYQLAAGVAGAEPLTASAGAFWYFRPGNLEQLVKVLDGRPVNGHWWVFLSSLSSVESWTMVDDLETGEQAVYWNPPRALGTRLDTAAFPRGAGDAPPAPVLAVPAPSPDPPEPAVSVPLCTSADALCFHGGRFAARLRWTDPRTGERGTAVPHPVPAAEGGDDTGAFRFFAADNVEVLVKVLDGRPVDGHWWVFWGELTDLALELEVYDRAERTVRRYASAGREGRSGADTAAFPGP